MKQIQPDPHLKPVFENITQKMANPLPMRADWSYYLGPDFTSHTLKRDSFFNNFIGTTKIVN